MKKFFAILLCAFCAAAEDAVDFQFFASATNLTVSEEAQLAVEFSVPALSGNYASEPPILDRRPAHVTAPFAEQDFEAGPFALELPQPAPRRTPGFTLNRYASNDPFEMMGGDPFSSLFGGGDPFAGRLLRFTMTRVLTNGVWRYRLPLGKLRALKPGQLTLPAVQLRVEYLKAVDENGRGTITGFNRRSQPLVITSAAPPAEGRPASFVQLVATNVAVSAALDTARCTSGDPLLLTLKIASDSPNLADAFCSAPRLGNEFKLDAASLKVDTRDGEKLFTWRLRAVQPGTAEIPPIRVAWYDPRDRVYREAATAAIPVQIAAGTEIALAESADAATAEATFPTADGLEFIEENDFTLQRAYALATACNWSAAAAAYTNYIARNDFAWHHALSFERAARERKARHLLNAAALCVAASSPAAAVQLVRRAELFAGATPRAVRTFAAAWTAFKNDPRADLPSERILFSFFLRLPLLERILYSAAALVLIVLLRVVMRRLFVFALICSLALVSPALDTFTIEPPDVAVGQQAAFVFKIDLHEKGERVEGLRFSGLPEATEGIEYGEGEALGDGRFSIPVRFTQPFSGTITPRVFGMRTVTQSRRFFSSSSSRSFQTDFTPLELEVKPLPTEGRPADFAGACGRNFALSAKLTPQHVRPGDLVSIEWVMTFDGFVPSNAVPRRADVPGCKMYRLEDTLRTKRSITWRQNLIANSTNVTDVAALEFDYYDFASASYKTLRAPAVRLEFVSTERAATENKVVEVGGAKPATAPQRNSLRELRLVPNLQAPVVLRVTADEPARTTETWRDWERLETSRGAGWTPKQ